MSKKSRRKARPIRATNKPNRITATARVVIKGADAATVEKPATFSMVAYTGEPMRISMWGDPVVVDLETADVSQVPIPALYDHWADIHSVVGQVESLTIQNKQLLATGKFTIPEGAEDSNAKRVLALAKSGYQWQASVGADPATVEEIKAGAVGVANWGREYPGPCVIGRGCKFREMSFVVLGGDRRTSATVAARFNGSSAMTFEQWLLSMGFDDPAALTEVQRANLEIAFQEANPEAESPAEEMTETPPAEPVSAEGDVPPVEEEEKEPMAARGKRPAVRGSRKPDPIADLRRRSAAEITRQAVITEIAARYNNPTIKVGGRQVPLAAHAIAQGWDRNRVELEALRNDRPAGPHLHIPSSGPALSGTTGNQVIEAALCTALGQRDVEKRFKPEILESAHTRFKGRIGLQQVMILAASQNGYHPAAGDRIHAGNIREILGHAMPSIRASGASTVSLPGIFANVANKELLTGYMEEDQSWREVAAIKSVPDFKSVTSYRLLDNMAYEQVGADGKIKHGSVSEESYTRQANTYAKMFTLTRRDIINDDLGAFNDLRNRLGRGAAQKFNDVFWTEFLSDHATFFTTARTNYISGATTNLGTDGVGLGLGVKAFRQMTSPTADGTKRIGGNPEILLVPPELESVAEALYVTQNLTSGVSVGSANIYANKYRPVVCAWLSDSSFTGYSTTAWYLLRSPGIMPMVVASFLNGNEAPTVEDSEADFDTLGVQFRGYHDFGCDQAEYLCGIKSKGAA